MNITVFGFKTFHRSDPGEVIFHGDDGVKAEAAGLACLKKGFVRAAKVVNPALIPITPPPVSSVVDHAAEAKAAAPAEAPDNDSEPVSDEPKKSTPKKTK